MPIVNGQYQAPTWVNGQRPPINAEELQAMSDTLQNAGVVTLQDFFNHREIVSSQTQADKLVQSTANAVGVSVGQYALFCGGGNPTPSSIVTAYDENLTKSIPTPLSVAQRYANGATVAGYALIAGGTTSNGVTAVVSCYDGSLTMTTPTELSVARDYLSGCSVGDYALFAGGENGSGTLYNVVDVYNESLTLSSATPLSSNRSRGVSTNLTNYAIFASNDSPGQFSGITDAYDVSLTMSTITPISVSVGGLSAATAGIHSNKTAIFVCGGTAGTVNLYDESLVQTIQTNAQLAKYNMTGLSFNGNALFAGGNIGTTYYSEVYVFDDTLTFSQIDDIGGDFSMMASAKAGKYAIFAGGYNYPSNYSDSVYAYSSQEMYSITIPPFCIYNFNSEGDIPNFNEKIISGTGTVNGYIKFGGVVFSGDYS